MRWIAGIVLFLTLAGAGWAQSDENWGGTDTVVLTLFRADSTRYSRAFKLSTWTYGRFEAYANDTSNAGFNGDSVKFEWGIQTMHPAFNSSRTSNTWVYGPLTVIDTFNLLSPTNPGRIVFDSTGAVVKLPHGAVDTTSLTGWAIQSRNLSPTWDVDFRFWAKGILGNKKASYLKCMFQSVRGSYYPTRTR